MPSVTVVCSCPMCGKQRVDGRQFTLFVGDESRYEFTCPHCGDLVVRAADANVVALLDGRVNTVRLITEMEIQGFVSELEDTGRVGEWMRRGRDA